MDSRDFPGDTVAKNLPANSGDTGSIPAPGRTPHAKGQLSPCSRACEPQALHPHAATTEAHTPRAHALQQEKSRNEKPLHSNRRVASAHYN